MIPIETEFTPNPNSLKFNVGRTLLERGSAFYANRKEAESSLLAKKIFEIPQVANVLIGQDFVTITRVSSVDSWKPLIAPVTKALEEYFAACESGANPEALLAGNGNGSEGEIEGKIKTILDEYIRPAVARDGGDIVFRGYKDGIVSLHMQGACSHCPSAIATLKSGVERLLREHIPEVKEVVQVW